MRMPGRKTSASLAASRPTPLRCCVPPTRRTGAPRRYDQACPCPSGGGTRRQVLGTLSRLLLDENHQRLGQNTILLHGLGGSL